jgi:hypothetical protein
MLITVLSDTYFTATRLDRPGLSHPQNVTGFKHKKRASRLPSVAGVASLFAATVTAVTFFG